MCGKRVIIVGGGLSGLGAAIRLSQYGHRVTVFERHAVAGGLNSYYRRHGKCYDTGLHAMTNLGTPDDRSLPLNRLLRQLRIRRGELELCPQKQSSIRFPGAELSFSNDFSTLERSVSRQFPKDADGFSRLVQRIKEWNPFVVERGLIPTRPILEEFLASPQLRAMLAMPVMFYGNPLAEEMDFRQFCIIFRSMFLEGMGRPRLGMEPFLGLLVDRLRQNGGEVKFSTAVTKIVHDGAGAIAVETADGALHQADVVLSSIGAPETGRLLQGAVEGLTDAPIGQMGYVEFVFDLSMPPNKLGVGDSVSFIQREGAFQYRPAREAVGMDSLVVCAPGNFEGVSSLELRVTALASPAFWQGLEGEAYRLAKADAVQKMETVMEGLHPGFKGAVVRCQMYTPCTFAKFTARANGAIYGSPEKNWDGRTRLDNLWMIGTDQGYLGIVGALMSGVTIANEILRQ